MHVFETPGQAALRLELPAGIVRVDVWDEPRTEVDVSALRGDEASRDAAAQTRVEAAERGGRHEILVEAPKREGRFFSWGRGAELSVAIRCPAGTDLELESHSADLLARGTLGEVGARTASGDVALADTRALQVTTASGDLLAGAVDGVLVVKTASGDVDVESVAERATVNTVSGDIRVGSSADAATLSTVSGDVDLGLAGAGVRVNSVSGDVEVVVRAGLGFWIDAQSVSGTIASELDVGEVPAEPGERPLELRVRTVSGDIRLARAVASTA